ncbi:hypothetical protein [Roseateles sp.]|uniref:YncE family protein n=1 Tax=Roseateles sp. TaxID=1971397 RepID=UPI002F4064BD
MNTTLCAAAAALTVALLAASHPARAADAPATAGGKTAYKVATTIKTDGQGDILAIRADTDGRRLYVARKGAVEVIDLDAGNKIGQVTVGGQVSAIALSPETGRGYATSTGENTVTMFDLKSLQALKTVKSTGEAPGAIEFEPKSKRLFVSHQKGGKLVAMSPDTLAVAGSATLGDRLRGITADSRGNLFVADEAQDALHVLDTTTLKSRGLISVWPASKPTALVNDDRERRIYTATASGRMVVIDPDIGQMVGYVPIGKGDGGIAAQFAPNRFVRLFVPTADGQLTVVQNAKLTATVESTLPSAGVKGSGVAIDGKSGKAYVANSGDILVLAK